MTHRDHKDHVDGQIKIERIMDGDVYDEMHRVFVRGHGLDGAAVRERALLEHNAELGELIETWMRLVPSGEEHALTVYYTDAPAPGAMAVTVADVIAWADHGEVHP